MNEQLVHAATWVNFHKNYAERSHTKESTYYLIFFFFNSRKYKQMTESRSMVVWDGELGEVR